LIWAGKTEKPIVASLSETGEAGFAWAKQSTSLKQRLDSLVTSLIAKMAENISRAS
jgi:hypothetical protein